MLTLVALATLGIGPPAVWPVGVDLTDPRVGSFAWSYSGRESSFGFGSDTYGDWSWGEVRIRQPLVDQPVPRTYGAVGGGFADVGVPVFEVPVRRGWWPRRQKIKVKIKDRSGW